MSLITCDSFFIRTATDLGTFPALCSKLILECEILRKLVTLNVSQKN